MPLSPGLVYLFRRLHFFLLPPIVVYLAFKAGKHYLAISTPTWIIVLATLLARPTLTFARNQYTDYKDREAAAALGAVLAPHVPESPFTVAKKALGSIGSFPGLSIINVPSVSSYQYLRLKENSWLTGQRTTDILSVFLDSQVVW